MTPTYESLIVNTYIDIAAALELLGRSMSGKQHAPTGGRMIVKSVSADYLDRKGAQDNE